MNPVAFPVLATNIFSRRSPSFMLWGDCTKSVVHFPTENLSVFPSVMYTESRVGYSCHLRCSYFRLSRSSILNAVLRSKANNVPFLSHTSPGIMLFDRQSLMIASASSNVKGRLAGLPVFGRSLCIASHSRAVCLPHGSGCPDIWCHQLMANR